MAEQRWIFDRMLPQVKSGTTLEIKPDQTLVASGGGLLLAVASR